MRSTLFNMTFGLMMVIGVSAQATETYTYYSDNDLDGLGDPDGTSFSCNAIDHPWCPQGADPYIWEMPPGIISQYVLNADDMEPYCATNDTDVCGECGGDGLSCAFDRVIGIPMEALMPLPQTGMSGLLENAELNASNAEPEECADVEANEASLFFQSIQMPAGTIVNDVSCSFSYEGESILQSVVRLKKTPVPGVASAWANSQVLMTQTTAFTAYAPVSGFPGNPSSSLPYMVNDNYVLTLELNVRDQSTPPPWANTDEFCLGGAPDSCPYDLVVNECFLDVRFPGAGSTYALGDYENAEALTCTQWDFEGYATFDDAGENIAPTALQEIHLRAGWNTISFNVLPQDTGNTRRFEHIFASISDELVMVKNENGIPWVVGYYNMLDLSGSAVSFGEGYLVKVSEDCTLTVSGEMAEEDMLLGFRRGWNMLGTTLKEPLAPECLQEYIGQYYPDDEGIIILKNNQAAAYLPEWSFNGIGELMPGEGYLARIEVEGGVSFDWDAVRAECTFSSAPPAMGRASSGQNDENAPVLTEEMPQEEESVSDDEQNLSSVVYSTDKGERQLKTQQRLVKSKKTKKEKQGKTSGLSARR